MAKQKNENKYPLPDGYKDSKSYFYVPEKYLEAYQDLERYPDAVHIERLIESAYKLIELEAETQVRSMPAGVPRETARDGIQKTLAVDLESLWLPRARHRLRVALVKVGEKNRLEHETRLRAHLLRHTCSVCGELVKIAPHVKVPLSTSRENGTPWLNRPTCLSCEAVAKSLYAEQLGAEKVGNTTRAEKVREALAGVTFSP